MIMMTDAVPPVINAWTPLHLRDFEIRTLIRSFKPVRLLTTVIIGIQQMNTHKDPLRTVNTVKCI